MEGITVTPLRRDCLPWIHLPWNYTQQRPIYTYIIRHIRCHPHPYPHPYQRPYHSLPVPHIPAQSLPRTSVNVNQGRGCSMSWQVFAAPRDTLPFKSSFKDDIFPLSTPSSFLGASQERALFQGQHFSNLQRLLHPCLALTGERSFKNTFSRTKFYIFQRLRPSWVSHRIKLFSSTFSRTIFQHFPTYLSLLLLTEEKSFKNIFPRTKFYIFQRLLLVWFSQEKTF